MRENTRLCRFTSKAGFALALCAALCASTWSDNAFATVDLVLPSKEMKFGKAAGDADISGTIIVNTSSQKSFTGGAYDIGNIPVSGRFKLLGDEGTAYTCSFPASIQLSNGGNTMTLDSFTTSPALTGTIGASEEVYFDVGATLHLAPGQVAADYNGSLPLDGGGWPEGRVGVTVRHANAKPAGSLDPAAQSSACPGIRARHRNPDRTIVGSTRGSIENPDRGLDALRGQVQR